MRRSLFLCLLLAFALGGCVFKRADPKPAPTATTPAAGAPKPAPSEETAAQKADQQYRQGVRAYENGQYKEAEQLLRNALDGGLAGKAEQVGANKFLAFIACSSRQQEACRNYFGRALAIDPAFELSRTEAGHPVWGKVFRDVKAERQRRN